MAFDCLGFIALCFGFSIISNSNNFFKKLLTATVIYSSQSIQYMKCYTWNSCRLAVFSAIILHFVLPAQMLGDPRVLVGLHRRLGSVFLSLTVGLDTSQPTSCFVNVDSKNNLMYCVILILSLTTFQGKYYIFHNSLLEFVLFLPVSLFSLSTEQVLFFIFDSLLTGASFAACWANYQ